MIINDDAGDEEKISVNMEDVDDFPELMGLELISIRQDTDWIQLEMKDVPALIAALQKFYDGGVI